MLLYAFTDAFKDTALMIPWLLVIYLAIELFEYKYGTKISSLIGNARKSAPVIGAALGCIPQCGFSVISTALYARKLITAGTLLAVYLSTSDEAIPVIFSQPDKLEVILPIILTKLVIAIVSGYSIDLIFKKTIKPDNYIPLEHVDTEEVNEIYELQDEKGCCGHHCVPEKPDIKEIFIHPLKHTFKVFIFIFMTSLAINLIILKVGEQNLSKLLMGHTIFQPVITGIFGLIPNCAASVAITQVFLKGGISFGSVVAGLSSSAGLGMLVLIKENGKTRDSLRIIGLLLAISIIAGIIIQYTVG